LLAHELTHVVQQNSGIVQRYGHDNNCKDDIHLKPFIWPGHEKAKAMLDATIAGISTSDTKVAKFFPGFFGNDVLANLSNILPKYIAIRKALDDNYLYRCNGSKCKAERAETLSNNDISLCFNKISSRWSTAQVGALIIHENYHRVFGRGHIVELNTMQEPDGKIPVDNPPNCANGLLSSSKTSDLINNPDSYSCAALIFQ
jgi:hypothetical protein